MYLGVVYSGENDVLSCYSDPRREAGKYALMATAGLNLLLNASRMPCQLSYRSGWLENVIFQN